MMDLFSSFNPTTWIFFLPLSLNWLASLSVLIFLPQNFWLVLSKPSTLINSIYSYLMSEIESVLGSMINPGTMQLFLTLFFTILFNNFLGLFPYVFTSSSHFSFTLSLSLPIWLGYMIISMCNQFNMNMAHLVPEGTPNILMPLMVLIESVSLVIRPFTLAIRLAANMVAGHLLLTLLGNSANLNSFGISLFVVVAICLLLLLECAVACIQSYVFTILNTLYISEHNSKNINYMNINKFKV